MSFYDDVIRCHPEYQSTRRIAAAELLEPATRDAVVNIVRAARGMGLPLYAFETYRSRERQQELFRQGATQLQAVGVHHYGLACDLVRVVDRELRWDVDYAFLGDLARENGMIWGGDWGRRGVTPTFVDAAHLQRVAVEHQPALFAGEWYPDADYDPYA